METRRRLLLLQHCDIFSDLLLIMTEGGKHGTCVFYIIKRQNMPIMTSSMRLSSNLVDHIPEANNVRDPRAKYR